MIIQQVDVEKIRPLRSLVLRPGQPIDSTNKAIYDIKNLGGDLIWCRARLVAIDFYQSIGFLKIGPIYEIEGIGPHYTMYKYL